MCSLEYIFSVLAFLPWLCWGAFWESLPCGLPNALPSSKRSNITVGEYTGPIGLVVHNWASAQLMNEIFKILAEERLGYHVRFSLEHSSSSTAVQIMSNCRAPGALDPDCKDPSPTAEHHVLLEVWYSIPDRIQHVISVQKTMAPELHGSIGYEGVDGMFALASVVNKVYESKGLPLAYYRSWNASWSDVSSYFSSYTDFDVTQLKSCQDTRMNIGQDWVDYLKYTNDAGGVEMVDGEYKGKCEGGLSGHWWFAPACRSQPENCIPVITGGGGWSLEIFSQQAAAYNMPLALATARKWSDHMQMAREHTTLIQWWKPDTSYVNLHPQYILFPENDKAGFLSGDKRTQNAAVPLRTVTHYSLLSVAPRARDLVANILMPMAKIDAALGILAAGASMTNAACQWLKSNEEVWSNWIPDATICRPGSGIVDETGKFVTNKTAALSCEVCTPGKASQETAGAATFICVDCPLGRTSAYQSEACFNCTVGRFASAMGRSMCVEAPVGTHVPHEGATQSTPCFKGSFAAATGNSECAACNVGVFADLLGSTECRRCPTGKFADAPGHTECKSCSTPDTSTSGLGSQSEAECVCRADTYRLGVNATGLCQGCPPEMSCPQGSTKRSLMSMLTNGEPAQSVFSDSAEPYPVLTKGFWSTKSEPFSIYKCWSEYKCPGGLPGACAPNMDLTKLSCSHCEEGYFWTGEECTVCTDPEKSNLVFPGLLIVLAIVAIVFMYEMFRDEVPKWNSWQNKCVAMGFLAFNHYQVITLLGKANIEVPSELGDLFNFWQFTESADSIFSLHCAGFGEFKSLVIAQSLSPIFFFLCVLLVAAAYWLGSKFSDNWRMALDTNRMSNVFFTVIFTYFVGIASMSMALFQCRDNPNSTQSLSADLSVVCFESDWNGMLVVALFAVLLYCVGMGALFAWVLLVVARLPRTFDDRGFQMRWKFLLIKFRPEVHWWALVFLSRGILLNLSFVIFTSGIKQTFWFLTVEFLYMLMTVMYTPWRFQRANGCSVFMSAMIVYLATLPLIYAETDEQIDRELAWFGVVVSFFTLVVTIEAVAEAALFNTPLFKRSISSVEIEKTTTVFRQFVDSDSNERSQMMSALGDWDRWHLRMARDVLESEFFGIHLKWRRQESQVKSTSCKLGLYNIGQEKVNEVTKDSAVQVLSDNPLPVMLSPGQTEKIVKNGEPLTPRPDDINQLQEQSVHQVPRGTRRLTAGQIHPHSSLWSPPGTSRDVFSSGRAVGRTPPRTPPGGVRR